MSCFSALVGLWTGCVFVVLLFLPDISSAVRLTYLCAFFGVSLFINLFHLLLYSYICSLFVPSSSHSHSHSLSRVYR